MMRRLLALFAILVPLMWVTGSPGTADAAVVTSVRGDTLTISGDGADDTVVLRLQAGAPDKLVVEAGTSTRSFDRASFTRISIRTAGGADNIRIDEADGAFSDTEAVTIESGAGKDAVTGGRGAEVISTGDDGDLVLANGGGDRLLLGTGDDTAIQASEDGADVIEGQSGTDTLRISGTSESEEFTVQASGGRALISRDVGSGRADTVGIEVAEVDAGGGPDLVDVGNLSGTALARVDADLGVADGARDTVFAAGSPVRDTIFVSASGDTARVTGLPGEVRVENASSTEDGLTVQGSGGNDEIRALGAVGTIVDLILEGNDGLDNITGGVAVEVLRGGPGPDTLRGFQGADTIEGGDGSDLVLWSPTIDGNDTVRSDAGEDDTLRIPGSSTADAYEILRDGAQVRVRGAGSEVSLDAVETIDVGASAGADTITVRDLTGTPTEVVRVDMVTSVRETDTVAVEGTSGPETVRVTAGSGFHELTGLPVRMLLVGAGSEDRLEVDGRNGDDTIDASKMTKDQLQPFLRGGNGKDVLIGSPGQDEITGGPGVDVALLGGGLDTFTWLPGDGGDIVEGGAGTDFVVMSGTGANEHFRVSPIGGRTRLIRDSDVLDMGDVERLDVLPAGGADTMQVDDMSGTDTDVVQWNLATARSSVATDQAADALSVNGTFGNDTVDVAASGPEVRMTGLAATVVILRSDPNLDRLHLDTKPGTDVVTVAPAVHQRLIYSQI